MLDDKMHFQFMYWSNDHHVAVQYAVDSLDEIREVFRGFLLGCTFTEGSVNEFMGEDK